MARKTLFISDFNVSKPYWAGIAYDLSVVVAETEGAAICAPPAMRGSPAAALSRLLPETGLRPRRLVRELRALEAGRLAEATTVEDDVDLCFVVLFFPSDLALLDRIRGWRERSKVAALFLLEIWSGEIDTAPGLDKLDLFDHVFVVNEAAVQPLRSRVRAPVSQLSLAVNARRAAPAPVDGRLPPRQIDVLSLGRRAPRVHERLLELSRRRGFFYQYDVWTGMRADDWESCREMGAELMRRSRYAVVWGPTISPLPHKIPIIRDDRQISARFFEATAGGAVMIGGYHSSPLTERLLDWPDAIVRIREDGEDAEAVIAALEADPARLERVRTANIVNALRRHDWSHRWAEALETLRLEPTEALLARQAALETLARAVETAEPARARA